MSEAAFAAALPEALREARLTEWTEEGPRQVRLAVDPALTPQANMERYYRRYRRIADSAVRDPAGLVLPSLMDPLPITHRSLLVELRRPIFGYSRPVAAHWRYPKRRQD